MQYRKVLFFFPYGCRLSEGYGRRVVMEAPHTWRYREVFNSGAFMNLEGMSGYVLVNREDYRLVREW